ncbi:sigma-70 family RNA polymerase sigma factor [Streptomyces sp. BPTC-684]|uniref:RNA polymerase sigma factor n=1 Tax=Streptomyces sp. BPTC-684 TaxID=3043734 RepID=UPI0024B08014|nr:sigma-70 family RNA polymerase sigma factor [Streptomyces sp. BPTC-684]WHM41152.1 sigma-70 family RNA polymerase sigma factor [Streptomyces sp. BPTC-684]
MTGHSDVPLTHTSSFNRFYTHWFPRGIGFAVKAFNLSQQDAEEAASDAMTATYAAWGAIDNPEAYFQHVLQKRAIEKYRSKRRRESRELPTSEDQLVSATAELPADLAAAFTASPEHAYEQNETRARINSVLAMLAPHERISLALETQGFTAKERAEIKGIPEDTERTHLYRARLRCMELIRKLHADLDSQRSKKKRRQSRKGAGE